jgi:hypothetical protein
MQYCPWKRQMVCNPQDAWRRRVGGCDAACTPGVARVPPDHAGGLQGESNASFFVPRDVEARCDAHLHRCTRRICEQLQSSRSRAQPRLCGTRAALGSRYGPRFHLGCRSGRRRTRHPHRPGRRRYVDSRGLADAGGRRSARHVHRDDRPFRLCHLDRTRGARHAEGDLRQRSPRAAEREAPTRHALTR